MKSIILSAISSYDLRLIEVENEVMMKLCGHVNHVVDPSDPPTGVVAHGRQGLQGQGRGRRPHGAAGRGVHRAHAAEVPRGIRPLCLVSTG